ncbi:MAG: coproporphyrinogen III oxidase family protein [Campylobacterales bacterium]|nr:coproporphyrinogen III oxidase family protein [Campylobacterales bacterium]
MLLYLHIPFCDSKCAYCAFHSYVDKFPLRAAYMQALPRQLEFELERFGATPQSIQTLFIGGGTPSTVESALYAPLFERLRPFLHPDAEITSEANPNSATPAWIEGMRDLGVNRLSFGVQSFDADKLRLLHRAHNSSQAITALRHARAAGFEHLSLDLIYGVQGDSAALLLRDLDQALELEIDHLSAYALTIEAHTAFADRPERAQEKLRLTRKLFHAIESAGLKQYEISNFGRYRSRHNMGYWEHRNYIGLGSGAVGFLNDRRFYPTQNIEHYIADPRSHETEWITPDALHSEKLFLGLRSVVGVDQKLLSSDERARAELLVREGKLTCNAQRYYNPDYLLSDELALFIGA